MEGRMERFRQLSPERGKARSQTSSKLSCNNNHHTPPPPPPPPPQHHGKVPVIYYLCRNQQLEHPHFMEVPLSSSKGLYLKDVVERLNVLRGRRVASMYSWSCKRSYRNGYVWHDLCEDDLILPAHGNEYILKGSELFQESHPGQFIPSRGVILQNQKALPEPPSARSEESSRDDELSPTVHHPRSSMVSPDSSAGKNSSWNSSLNLVEHKLCKNDASTQTDGKAVEITETGDVCARHFSTDYIAQDEQNPKQCREYKPLADKNGTLESLIQADMRKLNNLRLLEKDGCTKLKPSNLIMQLISCGSISVKDHRFGLIPTYKPTGSKFPSPLFSTSFILGDAGSCPAENPRTETNAIKQGVTKTTLHDQSSKDASRNMDLLRKTEDENVIRIEES